MQIEANFLRSLNHDSANWFARGILGDLSHAEYLRRGFSYQLFLLQRRHGNAHHESVDSRIALASRQIIDGVHDHVLHSPKIEFNCPVEECFGSATRNGCFTGMVSSHVIENYLS